MACLRQSHPLIQLKCLSCYLTTAVLNDYYSELTAYTPLAYSYKTIVATMCMDAKATPTNNTD